MPFDFWMRDKNPNIRVLINSNNANKKLKKIKKIESLKVILGSLESTT